jgi:predicted house-cleaning noncanonical NTP pyrophosphatase (MazG superfamily)
MGTIEYSKLIRDRIPEIIEAAGKQAIIKKVQGGELLRLLNLKLEEELIEEGN